MLLAFLAAVLVQAPASAAPPAPAAAATSLKSFDSGPYRPDALQLAEQIMPADAYAAVLEKALINGLALGMEDTSPDDRLSPAVAADLEKAAVKAFRPHAARIHKVTLLRFARLFSSNFTPPEIADLAGFYASPVGRKLVAMKYAHVSSKDALRTLARDETTASDINKVNREATLKLMQKLDADDIRVLAELSKRPVFRKMAALKPMIDNLEAASANEEDPELDAAMRRAADAVLRKHQITN